MNDGKKQPDEVANRNRRKFLAAGAAGAAGVVVAATAAGYGWMKPLVVSPSSEGASSTNTGVSQAVGSGPSDPTFDSNGIQLPSLTSDPPHRQGSIYFRSDLSQMRLDDGASYYTIPKTHLFRKGAVIQSPVPQKIAIWRAPYPCTVTAIKGYQDSGTGSVITVYDGSTDLLLTDMTISQAGTWQDGGALAKTSLLAGDSIVIRIVTVSGSPNYISVQVDLSES